MCALEHANLTVIDGQGLLAAQPSQLECFKCTYLRRCEGINLGGEQSAHFFGRQHGHLTSGQLFQLANAQCAQLLGAQRGHLRCCQAHNGRLAYLPNLRAGQRVYLSGAQHGYLGGTQCAHLRAAKPGQCVVVQSRNHARLHVLHLFCDQAAQLATGQCGNLDS